MNQVEFENFLSTVEIQCNGIKIKSRYFFECNDGWLDLIHNLIKELFDSNWDGTLAQCKEKFGGLRFYIGSGSEQMYEIISRYESESDNICEICGKKGSTIGKHWFKTLCSEHSKDYNS